MIKSNGAFGGRMKSAPGPVSGPLIRIVRHEGRELVDQGVILEKFQLFLDEALIQDAPRTPAGRFLLRILGCVDFAGGHNKPVMLVGRKQRTLKGGMYLTLTVPVPTGNKQGPPTDGAGIVKP